MVQHIVIDIGLLVTVFKLSSYWLLRVISGQLVGISGSALLLLDGWVWMLLSLVGWLDALIQHSHNCFLVAVFKHYCLAGWFSSSAVIIGWLVAVVMCKVSFG